MFTKKLFCLMMVLCMSLFVAAPYVYAAEQEVPPAEAVKTVAEGSANAAGTTVAASANGAGTVVAQPANAVGQTVEATANAAGTTVQGAAGAVATTLGAVTGQANSDTKAEVKSENAAKQHQVEEAAKTAKAKGQKSNFAPKNKHKK